MPVYKRKYKSGTVLWYYKFQPPGAARNTLPIREFGFATKREAEVAERDRHIAEEQKHQLAKRGGVVAEVPTTLSMLLEEFYRQHAEKKLAPKTTERYHEQAASLDPILLAMPIAEITPLNLSREWNRLLASGGRHRGTKERRMRLMAIYAGLHLHRQCRLNRLLTPDIAVACRAVHFGPSVSLMPKINKVWQPVNRGLWNDLFARWHFSQHVSIRTLGNRAAMARHASGQRRKTRARARRGRLMTIRALDAESRMF